MFFAHSLPRRYPDLKDSEKAIETLSSFLEYGPLLLPEIVNISALPNSETTLSNFEVLQRRFSLTLINENEIEKHMRCFGPICLIFKSEGILHCGVAPVLYFPNYRLDSDSNEFGISVLHHLRMALGLIQDISFILDMSKDDYQNILNRRVSSREYNSFRSAIDSLFTTMGANKARLNTMEGAIQSISELLYPTDRYLYGEEASFLYFNQREWRLLGDFLINGKSTSISATSELQTKLINMDSNFFLKSVNFEKKKYNLVDLVQTLSEPYKNTFLSSIMRIHCRKDLYNDIKTIVENRDVEVTCTAM